jgi:hypothetical protein
MGTRMQISNTIDLRNNCKGPLGGVDWPANLQHQGTVTRKIKTQLAPTCTRMYWIISELQYAGSEELHPLGITNHFYPARPEAAIDSA